MAYMATLADSIVTFIESLELGDDVTVARWLPEEQLAYSALENLSGVKVVVLPYSVNRELTAEGIHDVNQEARIVVQRKVASTADYNAAMKIAEDIAAALVGQTLADFSCAGASLNPAIDYGKMADMNVFDAVIISRWQTYEDEP